MKKNSFNDATQKMLEASERALELSKRHLAETTIQMIQAQLLVGEIKIIDPATCLSIDQLKAIASKVFNVAPEAFNGSLKPKTRGMQLAFLAMAWLYNDEPCYEIAQKLSYQWMTGHKAQRFFKDLIHTKSERDCYNQVLEMIHECDEQSGKRLYKNFQKQWDKEKKTPPKRQAKYIPNSYPYTQAQNMRTSADTNTRDCQTCAYKSSCPLSGYNFSFCPQTKKRENLLHFSSRVSMALSWLPVN